MLFILKKRNTYLHIPVNYVIIMTVAQSFQYLSHVMAVKYKRNLKL